MTSIAFLHHPLSILDDDRQRDCSVCRRPKDTLVRERIVPEAYGGPYEDWNLRDVCPRCKATRRAREAVPAEPYDPESLRRLLEMHPKVESLVLNAFYEGATALRYGVRGRYDEHDAWLSVRGFVTNNFGWFRAHWDFERDLSEADRAFWSSPQAYDAVTQNVLQLIPRTSAKTWHYRNPERRSAR